MIFEQLLTPDQIAALPAGTPLSVRVAPYTFWHTLYSIAGNGASVHRWNPATTKPKHNEIFPLNAGTKADQDKVIIKKEKEL